MAWQDYEDEAAVCDQTLSSSRHALSGACAGADKKEMENLRLGVASLHREATKMAKANGVGKAVLDVLDLAQAAVEASASGVPADDAEFAALRKVVGSCLPPWQDGQGRQACNKVPALTQRVRAVQNTAGKIVTQHIEQCTLHAKFLAQREDLRTRLQIVFRAWREEVEHSGPARHRPQHWRVRRPTDRDRRAGSLQRACIPIAAAVAPRENRLMRCTSPAASSAAQNALPPAPPQPQRAALPPHAANVATAVARAAATRTPLADSRPNTPENGKKPVQQAEPMTLTQQIKALHTSIRVSPTRPNPRRNEPTPPAQKEAASRKRRQPEDVTPDRPKAKRRESTTIVARIGMELYHQMSEIGKQTVNQELGWRRGIG